MIPKNILEVWKRIMRLGGHSFPKDERAEATLDKLKGEIDIFAVENQLIDDEIKCIEEIIGFNKVGDTFKTETYWEKRLKVVRLKKQKLKLLTKKESNKAFIFELDKRINVWDEIYKEEIAQAERELPKMVEKMENLIHLISDSFERARTIGLVSRWYNQKHTAQSKSTLFKEMDDWWNTIKIYDNEKR